MEIETLEPDILVFRGGAYQSLATAFVNERDVLLIDALAEKEDAEAMREHLERELGVRVRLILMTHYMSDHMAGLKVFPGAQVAAHSLHSHTFFSQRNRTLEEEREFLRPSIELSGELTFNWGRHRLRVFHNAGKTPCTLNVDVPTADLVICGDNLVCNIAYLSISTPDLLLRGLAELGRLGRTRVIPGHVGVMPSIAPTHARQYLVRLGEKVAAARRAADPVNEVRAISIESCFTARCAPIDFEREWHARNLDVILDRGLYQS